MNKINKAINNPKFYTYGIVCLVILRLFLNAFVPLMDKTEARYAEIARIMAETNNWITPQIDYGVPFWAKPPLSEWLSAFSIKLFGVNEFAVRLPSLLLSLLLVFFIGKFAKKKNHSFYLSGFILLTLPEFLLHAGVVSTDTALAFTITLIFLSFWKAVNETKVSYWGYLMFISIGFGLLTKGPIVLILTMPPIILWLLYFKEYKTILKKFPWILGPLITILIAAPWYYLAELKTKGFLDYFIVGEHFKRYFDPSWHGDKYGYPKSQPFGIIWAFLFIVAFPWIQVVAIKGWKLRKDLVKNKWLLFLLLWLLWTPLFFTVSSSLLHTYTLPIMVPIALLTQYFWEKIENKKAAILTSLVLPFLILIAIVLSLFNNNLERYSNTDKYLLKEQIENTDLNLYYFGDKSYSSQFYSKNKIKSLTEVNFKKKVKQEEAFQIIIPNKLLNIIDPEIVDRLQVLGSTEKSKLYLYSRLND